MPITVLKLSKNGFVELLNTYGISVWQKKDKDRVYVSF